MKTLQVGSTPILRWSGWPRREALCLDQALVTIGENVEHGLMPGS
jgi:hypothetical protein